MSNLLRGLNATLTANSTIYFDTSELGENLFDRAQRLQLLFAAVSHRRADCSDRSFRSTRRRPPLTGRIS